MRRDVLEQSSEHALRFLELAAHRRRQIQVAEHERAQLLEGLQNVSGHSDRLVIARERLVDHVAHHAIDALTSGASERGADLLRDVVFREKPGPDSVIDVVIDIRDDVGDAHDVALQGQRARFRPGAKQLALLALGVLEDSIANLDGEIEVLQNLHDADRLPVVVEPAFHQLVQRGLARMSECGVAEVVAEADGFGEDFVEAKGLGDRARDLRYFEHVREARPVVIALRREEDLRLVLQPAKRFAVNDAVAVALIRRPEIVFRLIAVAAARLRALCRAGDEGVRFNLLQRFANVHRGCTARLRDGPPAETTRSVTLCAGT